MGELNHLGKEVNEIGLVRHIHLLLREFQVSRISLARRDLE